MAIVQMEFDTKTECGVIVYFTSGNRSMLVISKDGPGGPETSSRIALDYAIGMGTGDNINRFMIYGVEGLEDGAYEPADLR